MAVIMFKWGFVMKKIYAMLLIGACAWTAAYGMKQNQSKNPKKHCHDEIVDLTDDNVQPKLTDKPTTEPATKKQKTEGGSGQAEEKAAAPNVPTTKISTETCLKQADVEGHGLHCGFYALFNACMFIQNQDSLINNRELFTTTLESWEGQIAAKSQPHAINANLEPNEIRDLIAANHHAHIAVFDSRSFAQSAVRGLSLTDDIVNQIEEFRQSGRDRFAVVMNIGNDYGQKQAGTGHWLALCFTHNTVKVFNSGGASDLSLEFGRLIVHIQYLIFREDISLLTKLIIARAQENRIKIAFEQNNLPFGLAGFKDNTDGLRSFLLGMHLSQAVIDAIVDPRVLNLLLKEEIEAQRQAKAKAKAAQKAATAAAQQADAGWFQNCIIS